MTNRGTSSYTSGSEDIKWFLEQYLSRGLSIIPLRFKGKEPLIPWKEFQERVAGWEEVEEWFRRFGKFNVAIVTGVVSGNLVVIDFDDKEKAREFFEKVERLKGEPKYALMNTWWVETGKGVHVYLRIDCGFEEFRELFRTKPRLVDGVDIKAEGGYVVAPPSIHPTGKQYKFIQGPPDYEIVRVSVEEWKKILELLGYEEKSQAKTVGGRELSDSEILEIVELLRPAYKPGQRDFIVFYLSGWMRKAGVKYESARKVIELLAENDEEKDKRLYVLDRTYGLRGNPPPPEEYKGKSGLQEILEKTFGEERALEIIRRIEEILGVASPFRDSVIELLDYEKQLYAVANLRSLVVARARRVGENGAKLVYKERVLVVAPTKVIVFRNPLGGVTKYEIVFEGKTLSKPLHIGPATLQDIIDRLRLEGLVYHKRLVDDVLSAIIQAYIKRGKAEVREEIESPGFYLVDGKIASIRWEAKKVSKKELKEALELLNELAEKWFAHAKDRFATVVKWGLVSPFAYCYKQRGRWIPWLYLYGASYTGKTTLGEIILNMWDLSSAHRKSGSSIDTVPRLGYVLSSSTFPILVNEPGVAITREDVIEVMKSAIESTIARGKFVRGTYTEVPALATLVLTSNRTIPKDDALLRRVLVLRFTFGERISPTRAREFEKQVKPRLKCLKAIGYWVAERVVSEPKLLEIDWKDLAEKLLVEMFTTAGMKVPEWVKLNYEYEEDIYEDLKEAIRSYLVRRVNEEYSRFVGKVVVETEGRIEAHQRSDIEFDERVKIVLEKRLLPWAIISGENVYFTSDFAREIRSIIGDLGGLQSIAELLGWKYSRGFTVNGRKLQAMKVHIDELISFLKVETA